MIYTESIKKNNRFVFLYKKGKSIANKCLIMYVLFNNSDTNKLGISVSKKVGNSVVRHRVTRLIRESYRLNEAKVKQGCEIVVVARPIANEADFYTVNDCFLDLVKKHKLTKQQT